MVTADSFSASVQAWLDNGFAVLSVNYRGSTTFGRDFEEAILERPGYWEVEAGASRKQLERLTGVPPTEPFEQAGFAVRCEWGEADIRTLATAVGVLVLVEVLSFATVEAAVARGVSVRPTKRVTRQRPPSPHRCAPCWHWIVGRSQPRDRSSPHQPRWSRSRPAPAWCLLSA